MNMIMIHGHPSSSLDPTVKLRLLQKVASWMEIGELDFGIRKSKTSNRMLKRKNSFRRLPGFGLWRCRGFRFSDSDHDEYEHDPWAPVKQFGPNGQTKTASEGGFMDGELDFGIRKSKTSNRMLKRKKSFRRLPGFGLWRCRGFRFRLKLKRLRIVICGRKF
ncbi:hypothetical protein FH972_017227 [Carpinus fangiana]|uniref:Uncharacterized protein n=1 Tax=Carpinus fangiana TaxID=176857 RepID=A0A5N6RM68_9ROSI|nr:hypothetical protein FH972_017227 [Carpinus fangiana]